MTPSTADPAYPDVPAAEAPLVSGSFGERPALTLPDVPAPGHTSMRVLSRGAGAPVRAEDLLVAHYLGETWSGKRIFEETWDDGIPAAFSIGIEAMIPAWDKGLVGVPSGSRVLLVVTPDEGYGAEGLPERDIGGTDVLVYVVDVLGRHGAADRAPGAPAAAPAELPQVTDDGTGLRLATPAGDPPAGLRAATVVTGGGSPVRAGSSVVVQYTAITWADGNAFSSTWERGAPELVSLADADVLPKGATTALTGVPVGSRVLVSVPPSLGYGARGLPEAGVGGGDTLVYAIDVLGAYDRAKGTGRIVEKDDHDD